METINSLDQKPVSPTSLILAIPDSGKTELRVNQDFCFDHDRITTISMTQKALKEYSTHFEAADNLDENMPIFLDTNVLLEYYTISFAERKQVKLFLSKNKDRIYLTSQIEREFLRHRIDRINSYQKSLDALLNDFQKVKENVEDLKDGKIGNFSHYIDTNKILTNDYENIKSELQGLYDKISGGIKNIFDDGTLFNEIIKKEIEIIEVKNRLEGEADIERNDDFLELVSYFKIAPPLDLSEIEFLQAKYKALKPDYDSIKSDQSIKVKRAFPGCGEPGVEKVGDYIIYHEILKFMKENQSNVIFLTADVTKNDWLWRKKSSLVPFTHYIINHFVNTGKILYIFPAKDKIRVSYDSVYSEIDQKIESKSSLTEPEPIPDDGNSNSSDEISPTNQDMTDVAGSYLPRLRIVGKIDLFENQGANRYKKITDIEFLNELKKSENWANNYGDGFVGLDYFIKKILGHSKGFDIKNSFEIKDLLLEQGKITIWNHEPEDESYHSVDAIKIA